MSKGSSEEPRAMIRLAEAAALVHYTSTGKHTVDPSILNSIARLISLRVRVFTRNDDGEDYALVLPGELDEGSMRQGGTCLEFPDDRPPLKNLSILRRELSNVLHDLGKHFRTP